MRSEPPAEEDFVVPEGMDAELAQSLQKSARWLSDEGHANEEAGESNAFRSSQDGIHRTQRLVVPGG